MTILTDSLRYLGYLLVGIVGFVVVVFFAGVASGFAKEWRLLHGHDALDADGARRIESFGLLISHLALTAALGGSVAVLALDKPWAWLPAIAALGVAIMWYARSAVRSRLRSSQANGGSDRGRAWPPDQS